MASTVSLTKIRWIANQSWNRLADFLKVAHGPVEGGAALLEFDASDMAAFRDRCQMHNGIGTRVLNQTPTENKGFFERATIMATFAAF